jgi:hypothetical protein
VNDDLTAGEAAPQAHARQDHGRHLGSGPSPGADGMMQKREFLWKVHTYTNEYIRFADTKAGFCVGTASALIAALFASKSHELFIDAFSHKSSGTGNFLPIVSLLAFVALGTSIVAAVTAIRPRLWSRSNKGFIFWDDISKYGSATEFAAGHEIQTEIELTECLSRHLYTLATVCTRKYFWIGAAIWLVSVGGVLAVIVLLFKR